MFRPVAILMAIVGTAMMSAFVLGLSYSISTGFAGFWGGFPFLVISLLVIAFAIYNIVEESGIGNDR